MIWSNFKHYSEAPSAAFESLMNHLFERYIRRNHGSFLKKFRSVNGRGGDGGVEAYAELNDGSFIAVQSKWFDKFGDSQLKQIKGSIQTAMHVRPGITEYIICVPIDATSLKVVTAGKDADGNPLQQITLKSGDQLIDNLEAELKGEFSKLTIKWWFDHDIETELAEPENVGIQKFWFEKEVITNAFLHDRFEIAKARWLGERYVPQLHAQGFIENEIDASQYGPIFRRELKNELSDYELVIRKAAVLSGRIITDVPLSLDEKDKLQMFLSSLQDRIIAADIIMQNAKNAEFINELNISAIVDESYRWSADVTKMNRDAQNLITRFKELTKQIGAHSVRTSLIKYRRTRSNPHKVFLGKPGSGKTHALSHATEIHLQNQAPAVIIRADGTNNENWGTIMQSALVSAGWSMDEIFNALEAQAIREDRRKANANGKLGDELAIAPTEVLICVDGLEEATGHWDTWKQRIKECPTIGKMFNRLVFIFTSRNYFFSEEEIKNLSIQIDHIPTEGDVSYRQLIKPYLTHYGISLSSASLIRGIDGLFALRLFCLTYEGQRLDET